MNNVIKLKEVNSPNSAEVYYNYSSSGSCSYSDSTLQQSTGPSDPTNESVVAPTALLSLPGASHLLLKEDQEKPKASRKNIPRKVSVDDYYTKIVMSVNEIKISKRTTRMTAYFSLKEENDKKLSIFLRSSLTSSVDETFRGIRAKDNRILEDIAIEMYQNSPNDCKFLLGRLRYNPRKFKIEDDHKYNLKNAIVCIYYGKTIQAILWILDKYYPITLTDDLTEKQTMFSYTGMYSDDDKEEV